MEFDRKSSFDDWVLKPGRRREKQVDRASKGERGGKNEEERGKDRKREKERER